MFAASCSLEEIGNYVGDSSTYMTDRYRHLIEGQRERAAERLDEYLHWRICCASGTLSLTVER